VRIEVLYFASAREAAGRAAETLDLPPAATLADLRPLLSTRHPALSRTWATLRFAVGEAFASADDRRLEEGDRVALIPPVSGG
jgi:molybdopterin converting factor subunit 1